MTNGITPNSSTHINLYELSERWGEQCGIPFWKVALSLICCAWDGSISNGAILDEHGNIIDIHKYGTAYEALEFICDQNVICKLMVSRRHLEDHFDNNNIIPPKCLPEERERAAKRGKRYIHEPIKIDSERLNNLIIATIARAKVKVLEFEITITKRLEEDLACVKNAQDKTKCLEETAPKVPQTQAAPGSTAPTKVNQQQIRIGKRGPDPVKTTAVAQKMLTELLDETLSYIGLASMKQVGGAATYGVSRDIFCKARKAALSEFVGVSAAETPTVDK